MKVSSITLKRIRIAEHLLQVDLLLAVRTSLLFSHNAPATNTELMKSVATVKEIYFSCYYSQ